MEVKRTKNNKRGKRKKYLFWDMSANIGPPAPFADMPAKGIVYDFTFKFQILQVYNA